jgi:hypothetical protein
LGVCFLDYIMARVGLVVVIGHRHVRSSLLMCF